MMWILAMVLSLQSNTTRTLLVTNDGQDVLLLRTDMGRLGSVYPGQSECFRLPDRQDLRLTVRQLAGRAEYQAPATDLQTSEGWAWRLDQNLNLSSLNLTPAPSCAIP